MVTKMRTAYQKQMDWLDRNLAEERRGRGRQAYFEVSGNHVESANTKRCHIVRFEDKTSEEEPTRGH